MTRRGTYFSNCFASADLLITDYYPDVSLVRKMEKL